MVNPQKKVTRYLHKLQDYKWLGRGHYSPKTWILSVSAQESTGRQWGSWRTWSRRQECPRRANRWSWESPGRPDKNSLRNCSHSLDKSAQGTPGKTEVPRALQLLGAFKTDHLGRLFKTGPQIRIEADFPSGMHAELNTANRSKGRGLDKSKDMDQNQEVWESKPPQFNRTRNP